MASRTERTVLPLVLGLLAAPGTALAQSGAPELGIWINHTGKGAIETYLCGSNLCGKIVWLKEPNNDAGKPKRDANNPDPSKRNRPVCGVHSLANLKRMQGGGWGDGQAYNPEEGKTYDVAIRLADANTLKVTGSVLFFSKTVTWKRAKGQLQRCDQPAAPPLAPAPTATAPPPRAATAPLPSTTDKPSAPIPAAAAAAAAPPAGPAPAKPEAVTAAVPAVQPATTTPTTPVTSAPPAAVSTAPVAPNPSTKKAAPVATAPAAPVVPTTKVAAPVPAPTPSAKPAPVISTAKPAPQAKAAAPASKPPAVKPPSFATQGGPAIKPSGTGIPTATGYGYSGSGDTSDYEARPKPKRPVDAWSTFDPTPQASR